MEWPLNFISEEDLAKCVVITIEEHGYDEILTNDRRKYFHKEIFRCIDNCNVSEKGNKGDWDVVYQDKQGIVLPDGDVIHMICAEIENRYDRMSPSLIRKAYIRMQNQLLNDEDSACFLVEMAAQKQQNIELGFALNNKTRVSHKRIRRVSLDQFYAMTTGEKNAFRDMCMVLPDVIETVVKQGGKVQVPHDTVLQQLEEVVAASGREMDDMSMAVAIYMLGFDSYLGFKGLLENDGSASGKSLERTNSYEKRMEKGIR